MIPLGRKAFLSMQEVILPREIAPGIVVSLDKPSKVLEGTVYKSQILNPIENQLVRRIGAYSARPT